MAIYGEFPVTKMLAELRRDNLLPAILFRTARRQCDNDIERIAGAKGAQLDSESQQRISAEVERVIGKYNFQSEIVYGHPHFKALIATGVGAHHAGQLLVWRLLLEEMMTSGLLRLMVATGTVAAGVDFPARTVVITAHSKRGSEGFDVLSPSELQQMAGRAGRRGKDSVGICLVAPSVFSDARVINEVSKRPPEPLRSVYFAAPSTVLNLLKFRNVDDLRYTVERSLASFLDRKSACAIREEAAHREAEILSSDSIGSEARKKALKRVRRMTTEAETLQQRQEEALNKTLTRLRKLGYVEGSGLTEKGFWAAELCTSLVLELAEAINDAIFSDLSVEHLVALVASIAGDPHRPYFGIKANPIPPASFKQMETVVARVRESYEGAPPSDVKVLPDAALTVLTWMDAKDWPEFSGLLRLAGIAEGDVARLVSQTADHLNQISRLVKSHPDLAAAASEGRSRILKPPLSEVITTD